MLLVLPSPRVSDYDFPGNGLWRLELSDMAVAERPPFLPLDRPAF